MPKVEPFEEFPERYDKWYDENEAVYKSELNAIREQLEKNGNGIEIGVGTGRFAAQLGTRYGIDPSKSMLEFARKRGILVVQCVAEQMPFPDAQFDYALMVTVICFLDDILASFKEAHRILKRKGSLVIGFIDRNSSLGMLYDKHKDESVFYKDAHFYSVKEVVRYLKEAGFREFTITQTLFQPLNEIDRIEPPRAGHGEGSFVVLRARK